MKKGFEIGFFSFVLAVFLTACGGGGSDNNNKSNLDNITVDPQAYYVDIKNGNDANDGRTPANAWKTLDKINKTQLKAGNKILFRAGQKWRGRLTISKSGTAENPIIIGSYGEGTAPVISAVGIVNIMDNNYNNNVDDNEWIPYTAIGNEGLSKKYKEDVPDEANTWLAVILDTHPNRVKINGQEVLGAFDSSELSDRVKWSYNRDKNGTVFYYYGNDKPNQIETNLYTSPLYIHDNQYITIKDITLEGGYVAALFIENANNITVKNIQAGEMSKQGIYVKAENGTSKNINIQNCTIDSKYTLDYAFTGVKEKNGRTTTTRGAPEGIMFWGGVQDSTISGNTIKNWTHANINMSADNGEYLINNEVFNNTLTAPDIAYGGRIGLDGKNAANNNFHDNTIKDIKAPIQFNGHDNKFQNNLVTDIKQSPLKPDETGHAIIIQAYSSPVYNITVTNNTFKNIAKEPAILVSDNNKFEIKDITTSPNTFE